MQRVPKRAWAQFEGDKDLEWRADNLWSAGLHDEQFVEAIARSSVDLHWAIHVVRSGTANNVDPLVIFDVLAD
jgi:hypothetical protein